MPSRADQPTVYTKRRGLGASRVFTALAAPERIRIRGPWQGFVPDIEPSLLNFTAAKFSKAYIDIGGVLTPDNGFFRLEDAASKTLPLGDSSPPAATGYAITGIFQYQRRTTGGLEQIAVTADDGGSVGRMYRYDGTDWVHVAQSTLLSTVVIRGIAADLHDFAYFSWLAQVTGVAGEIPPVNGQIVFANLGQIGTGKVQSYPSETPGGFFYFDFQHNLGFSLNAKSVENFGDRIVLFNTYENGVAYTNRLRWSKIAGPQMDAASLGAGFINFDDFEGPGLRIETLGDVLACYFADGVAFVRRTALAIQPFRVDVVTKVRGLLGTFALVNVGSGQHFGLFEDGWFFLDSTGRWREAGILPLGNRQERYSKWKETFYNLLDYSNKDRIVCTFDRNLWLIRISFPSGNRGEGAPDLVWNYDLRNDTIWPDDYGDSTPNYWGEWDSQVEDVQWDQAAGTWDAPDVGRSTWDITEGIGRFRVLHGTTDGVILMHSRDSDRRDGAEFNPTFISHEQDLGSIAKHKTVDKLYIEYLHPPDPTSGAIREQEVALTVDATTYMAAIKPTKGVAGSSQADFVTAHQTGRRVGWSITGKNGLDVLGAELHVYDQDTDTVERGT